MAEDYNINIETKAQPDEKALGRLNSELRASWEG